MEVLEGLEDMEVWRGRGEARGLEVMEDMEVFAGWQDMEVFADWQDMEVFAVWRGPRAEGRGRAGPGNITKVSINCCIFTTKFFLPECQIVPRPSARYNMCTDWGNGEETENL